MAELLFLFFLSEPRTYPYSNIYNAEYGGDPLKALQSSQLLNEYCGGPPPHPHHQTLNQDLEYFTSEMSKHRLIPTEGSKLKHCVYCQFHKVKTKSGWRVSCRHKCEACDVPLCKEVRDCFQLYHQFIFEGKEESPIQIARRRKGPL